MSDLVLDPGRLDRRLTLEAPAESADGAGGVARSYSVVATLWGAVEPLSALAAIEAQALGAAVTHRIRIRYRTDLTLRHRLRDGARVFRIVTIRELHKRFLAIEAEERTD
jgi:SPP1 family predicted phage head-tail adaptor